MENTNLVQLDAPVCEGPANANLSPGEASKISKTKLASGGHRSGLGAQRNSLESGHAMLHGLQVGDRAAKGLPLLHEVTSPLEASLGQRDGVVSDEKTLLRQLGHQVRKALALHAEQS